MRNEFISLRVAFDLLIQHFWKADDGYDGDDEPENLAEQQTRLRKDKRQVRVQHSHI